MKSGSSAIRKQSKLTGLPNRGSGVRFKFPGDQGELAGLVVRTEILTVLAAFALWHDYKFTGPSCRSAIISFPYTVAERGA
jgi:hypothetical protein